MGHYFKNMLLAPGSVIVPDITKLSMQVMTQPLKGNNIKTNINIVLTEIEPFIQMLK